MTRDTDPNDTPRSLARREFLGAAGATAGALALGVPTAGAQSVVEETCDSGATFTVGDGDFEVINNQWSNESATQCIRRYDDGSFGWTFEGGSGEINYPESYVGTRPWGSDTGVAEFPIDRGNVDELTMSWDFDISVDSGEWNLAEEWWLLDGQPGSDPPLTHEIMLVCDWSPDHGHGEPIETDAWTDRFGNQIDYWAFYEGGGTDADFHIFRINGGAASGEVDLKRIIDYLDEEEGIRDDLTLTGIELGTETFDGPTGEVDVEEFGVTINDSTYESVGDGTSDGSDGSDGSGDDGSDGSDGSGGSGGSDGGDGSDGSDGSTNLIAEMNPSTTEPSVGERVTFRVEDATGSDRWITDLAWAFGDGTSGEGWWAAHSYDEAGTYTAALAATDNEGATTTHEVDITVS